MVFWTHCKVCGGQVVWVRVGSGPDDWVPTCQCILRKEKERRGDEKAL